MAQRPATASASPLPPRGGFPPSRAPGIPSHSLSVAPTEIVEKIAALLPVDSLARLRQTSHVMADKCSDAWKASEHLRSLLGAMESLISSARCAPTFDLVPALGQAEARLFSQDTLPRSENLKWSGIENVLDRVRASPSEEAAQFWRICESRLSESEIGELLNETRLLPQKKTQPLWDMLVRGLDGMDSASG